MTFEEFQKEYDKHAKWGAFQIDGKGDPIFTARDIREMNINPARITMRAGRLANEEFFSEKERQEMWEMGFIPTDTGFKKSA